MLRDQAKPLKRKGSKSKNEKNGRKIIIRQIWMRVFCVTSESMTPARGARHWSSTVHAGSVATPTASAASSCVNMFVIILESVGTHTMPHVCEPRLLIGTQLFEWHFFEAARLHSSSFDSCRTLLFPPQELLQ